MISLLRDSSWWPGASNRSPVGASGTSDGVAGGSEERRHHATGAANVVILFHRRSCGGGHGGAQAAVVQDRGDGLCERLGITGWDQEAIDTVLNDLGNPVDGRRDTRDAAGQRLHQRNR